MSPRIPLSAWESLHNQVMNHDPEPADWLQESLQTLRDEPKVRRALPPERTMWPVDQYLAMFPEVEPPNPSLPFVPRHHLLRLLKWWGPSTAIKAKVQEAVERGSRLTEAEMRMLTRQEP